MPPKSPVRVPKPGSLTGLGQGKARVTNGGRLNLFGDGRTLTGRRLRDLIVIYSAPLGGLAALDEATRQLVRKAAMLTVQSELIEARAATGEQIDPVAYATLTNALSRVLAKLEAKRPKATTPAPTPEPFRSGRSIRDLVRDQP